MAFIGLPCPINRAGIMDPVSGAAASLRMMRSLAISVSSVPCVAQGRSAAQLGGDGRDVFALKASHCQFLHARLPGTVCSGDGRRAPR